jgi:hypothetical protein
MIFKGAATPSSVVNLSIECTSWFEIGKSVPWFIANGVAVKGQNP